MPEDQPTVRLPTGCEIGAKAPFGVRIVKIDHHVATVDDVKLVFFIGQGAVKVQFAVTGSTLSTRIRGLKLPAVRSDHPNRERSTRARSLFRLTVGKILSWNSRPATARSIIFRINVGGQNQKVLLSRTFGKGLQAFDGDAIRFLTAGASRRPDACSTARCRVSRLHFGERPLSRRNFEVVFFAIETRHICGEAPKSILAFLSGLFSTSSMIGPGSLTRCSRLRRRRAMRDCTSDFLGRFGIESPASRDRNGRQCRRTPLSVRARRPLDG